MSRSGCSLPDPMDESTEPRPAREADHCYSATEPRRGDDMAEEKPVDVVVMDLSRNSRNFARVIDEIIRMEKKIFPKHESLSNSFDEELKKKNVGLLYIHVDGEVAGYVMYGWPTSLSASITKLAVKEKFRKQRYGELLMKAAIQRCRKRNVVTRVCLHVDPDRLPALNLYRKLGFVTDCVVEKYYSHNRDALRMYLDFDPQMSQTTISN